jgi:hypothetical protein
MTTTRRLAAALFALGITGAPLASTAVRAHAQVSDAEGADGGDVTGGNGGAGSSGILPTGSQNNAAPGDQACFADELCALGGDGELTFDTGLDSAGLGGSDLFGTGGFADEQDE